MYITSNEYKEKILEPTRKFESEIKIGNNILTNEEVMSFNIEQSIQQDATFSIGNTISTAFNLVFFHNNIIEIDDTDIITAKLGLILNNEIEYIPMGVYNIDNIETNDTTTTVLAYDNMIRFEVSYIENNEKPTLHTVINRLIELTGVKFAGILNDYPDYELTVLENYTCREILGFVAGILGANATIDRNGKFDFVVISNDPIYGKGELFAVLTKDGYILQDKSGLQIKVNSQTGYIKADNYSDYTKKNKNYKVSRITNSTDLEELSIGTNENMELSMSNPYITEDTLKVLNDNLNGLEFLPYSVTWKGDISLDIGDLVTVTDKKGSVKAHPILTQSISYNGALSCIIGAQGETTTANTYKSTTSEENEIERTNKKVVQIEKDAGEVYVVVYDEDNQSSVRLTESTLEAIADEIKLTAKNIKLEGLVTANDNCRINEDGSIETISEEDESGFFYKTKMNKGELEGGQYLSDEEQRNGYKLNSEGLHFGLESGTSNSSTTYGLNEIFMRAGDGSIPFQVNSLGDLRPTSGYNLTSSFDTGLLLNGDLLVDNKFGAKEINSKNYFVGGNKLGVAEDKDIYSGSTSKMRLGEILVLYGSYTVTNITADTVKTSKVSFDEVFSKKPFVSITPITSVPDKIASGINNITTTGFNINMTRTNTTDTVFSWVAIGKVASSGGAVG